MSYCAKGIDDTISCLDINNLKTICEAYNKEMLRKNKKDYISLDIIHSNDKKKIVTHLKKKLHCEDDLCIIKQKFINNIKNNQYIYERFKPEGPLDNEWLSNWDINYHMIRLQNYFSCLLYTGTVSIDFNQKKMFHIYKNIFSNKSKYNKMSCFYHFTNKCTVSNENKNINCIATIYNTSKRSEPGQHWIATFVKRMNDGEIKMYFFDSVGYKPPPEIKQFFKLLQNNLFYNNKIDKRYNNVRHQYKNSECGVYCIHFIENMIEHPDSFEEYISNKNYDDEMHKNRQNYFRPIIS